MPSCSVVIPSLNAEATISLQLDALSGQTLPEFEVIVVDNGSSDRTSEIASAYADRLDLKVVNEPRRGVNFARNAGIKVACGDVILMCDSDDVVDPRWAECLVSSLTSGSWIVGGIELGRLNAERTLRSSKSTVKWFQRPGGPVSYAEAIGANMAFWRTDWADVGGFDETLSGAGDEIEFFFRLEKTGVRGRRVPEAVVHYRLRPGRWNLLRSRFRNGRSLRVLLTLDTGRQMAIHGSPWGSILRIGASIALLPFVKVLPEDRRERGRSIAYHLGWLREDVRQRRLSRAGR